MDLATYQKLHQHNSNVLSNCLANRSVDISDIVFYEGMKGKDLSFDKLASKMFDILACCAIGALPSIAPTGADGYIWFNDRPDVEPIETKLCAIERKNIFVGKRGGLYWSSSSPTKKDNTASMKSYFCGKFDAKMSDEARQSKERWTSLVCFDRDSNSIIDAFIISPATVIQQLNQRKNNSTLTLKLSVFMNHGNRIATTVPSLNYNAWEKKQQKLALEDGRIAAW